MTESDPKIDVLLAEYMQRVDSGQPVDRDEFLQRHAEHADELRELLEAGDEIEQLVRPAAAETQLPGDPPTGQSAVDIYQEETWHPGASDTSPNSVPPATSPTEESRRFGDYELQQEIARGGMGVVFKARQVKLNRVVALKMILAGQLASQDEVARFYVEAQAAAALRHPNIVPVHDVGEHEGQHYLSMGFVDGESLADRIAKGPIPPRETAHLVRKLATAMGVAHNKGVIHRDLKPANILLERNGNPCITDFGLAKQTNSNNNLTATGLIFGTPSYMAPEQAAGETAEIGPLADVYSLGAILYCCLTGRPPFEAANVVKTIQQVMQEEPESVRTLNPKVPQQLETICLKCLHKDPQQRFASADELSAALKRFLLRSKQKQAKQKQTKQESHPSASLLHRKGPKIGLAVTAAVVLPLLIWAVTLFFRVGEVDIKVVIDDPSLSVRFDGQTVTFEGSGQPIKLKPGGHQFIVERDGFESKTDNFVVKNDGKNVLHVTLVDGKLAILKHGENPPVVANGGRKPADKVAKRGTPPPPAVAPFDAAKAKQHQQAWADHLGVKVEKEVDIGGGIKIKMVLIPPGEFMMGSSEEEQTRWLREATAAKDEKAIRLIPGEGPQHRVRITKPFYLAVHEVTQEQYQRVTGVSPSQFSSTGDLKEGVAGQRTHRHPVENVSWFDAVNFCNKLSEVAKRRPSYVISGNSIKWGDGNGYRLPSEAEWEYVCRAGSTGAYCCSDEGELGNCAWYGVNSRGATHPVGEKWPNGFGTYDMHGNVWEWCWDRYDLNYFEKLNGDDKVHNPHGPLAGIYRVHRGGYVFSNTNDCRSAFRYASEPNVHNFRIGFRLAAVVDAVVDAATPLTVENVAPPLAVVPIDAAESENISEVRRFEEHSGPITAIALAPNGKFVVSKGNDTDRSKSEVRVWNPATGTQIRAFHAASVLSLAVSPDSRNVAIGEFEGKISLYDTSSGEVQRIFDGHSGKVTDVEFSPDGTRLLSQAADGSARVWEVMSGKEIARTEFGTKGGFVDFSPNGKTALINSNQQGVYLWDLHSPKMRQIFSAKAWNYVDIEYSPDGRRALGLVRGGIVLIDVESGREIRRFDSDSSPVAAIEFLRDGRSFVSGSYNGTLSVWDVETGRELARVKNTNHVTLKLQVSPDGRWAVSGGGSHTEGAKKFQGDGDYAIRVWQLPKSVWPKTELGAADSPPPAVAPFNAEQAKAHQQAWAGHLGLPVETTNSIGMKFRVIPPGEFLMGSSEEEIAKLLEEAKALKQPDWFINRIPTEGPQHRVILTKPFAMSIHEVTRAQFRKFVKATGHKTDAEKDGKGGEGFRDGSRRQSPDFLWNTKLGFDVEQTDEHPVVNVTWNDAVAFCEWLSEQESVSYRLPTEAEWEFACRAGSSTRYSFGDEQLLLKAYTEIGGRHSNPVGRRRGNAWGLFDLHGNVAEYCQDRPTFYASKNTVTDPIQDGQGIYREIRGGAFWGQLSSMRSASRGYLRQDQCALNVGFRVVRPYPFATRASDPSVGVAGEEMSKNLQPVQSFLGHAGGAWSIAFSPDGKRFVSTGHDKTIKLWDTSTGRKLLSLNGHTEVVGSAAFSPDGKQIVSGSHDKMIGLWNSSTGRKVRTLSGHTEWVASVAFSPDGKLIASGSYDNTIRLWNSLTGQEIRTIKGHHGSVACVNFSPDGKQLVSSSYDRTIMLWDALTGERTSTLTGHSDAILCVAFSPDGKRIAGGSRDGAIKLWDATSGKETLSLGAHTARVTCFAFSPNGKWIISGSHDQTIKLWNSTTGKLVLNLSGQFGAANGIDFSPNGRQVVAGIWNGNIASWEVSKSLLASSSAKTDGTPLPAVAPFNAEQAKAHQQAWADHLGVPVETTNSIGMKFRLIPPGEFLMGSSKEEIAKLLEEAGQQGLPKWHVERIPSEGPQHRVSLSRPFAIGIHEITRGQFRKFVDDAAYKTDAETDGKGGGGYRDGVPIESPDFLWNTKLGFSTEQTDQHPVVNVSWNDAIAFCLWLSKKEGVTYRLPSEAEWAFACRAGSQTRFSCGNDEASLSAFAWYGASGGRSTMPVGQKRANVWGLFDLHGNVWEWCQDKDGPYKVEPAVNPVGALHGFARVMRGGDAFYPWSCTRSAVRFSRNPQLRGHNCGFRLAMTYDVSTLRAKSPSKLNHGASPIVKPASESPDEQPVAAPIPFPTENPDNAE